MVRERLIIGSLDFGSKSEALAHFKEMLGRYHNNQEIGADDSEHLHALLARHPEAVDKIGCGVRRFHKRITSKGTSCFWLERENGDVTDFSYISCVNVKGNSLYQEFAEACRETVQPELDQAKKRHFEQYGNQQGRAPCDITGQMIAPYESHLDHKKPMTFQVIVRTFVKAHRIEIKPDMLSIPADAQFATTFVDLELARRFREYHHEVADLRIIRADANLRLGGSERITRAKRPVILDPSS